MLDRKKVSKKANRRSKTTMGVESLRWIWRLKLSEGALDYLTDLVRSGLHAALERALIYRLCELPSIIFNDFPDGFFSDEQCDAEYTPEHEQCTS